MATLLAEPITQSPESELNAACICKQITLTFTLSNLAYWYPSEMESYRAPERQTWELHSKVISDAKSSCCLLKYDGNNRLQHLNSDFFFKELNVDVWKCVFFSVRILNLIVFLPTSPRANTHTVGTPESFDGDCFPPLIFLYGFFSLSPYIYTFLFLLLNKKTNKKQTNSIAHMKGLLIRITVWHPSEVTPSNQDDTAHISGDFS